MRVLHVGCTGNLGTRVIPALLAHGHIVIAYVRSPQKFRGLMPPEVLAHVTLIQGDGFDSTTIAQALRQHGCDAIVNTAGTREPPWCEQTLGTLVASVTSAAIEVGKERGKPLRAWIIGGMGSLQYPGTGYQIQDYMPRWMMEHHRGTEHVMKAIPTSELVWSLLCVAMMYPESETIRLLLSPRENALLVATSSPPGWQDHWIRNMPIVGPYLNLVPAIRSYTTKYEDVADLIAGDLAKPSPEFVGHLVGYKAPEKEGKTH